MYKLNLFVPRSFESKLYDEVGFYPAFTADLKQATSRIIIESPFICYRRAAGMIPELVRAMDRGVSITLNTRHPSEHDGSMKCQAEAIVQTFENMGVRIQFTKKLHRKVAVIDKSIVWEGSLNIMSHANTREMMHRIQSKSHCRTMMRFLSVKR